MSKRSHKTVGIKVFLTSFAWWYKNPDPYLWFTEPDPGGVQNIRIRIHNAENLPCWRLPLAGWARPGRVWPPTSCPGGSGTWRSRAQCRALAPPAQRSPRKTSTK
jgi:hypothetical protein